MELNHDQKAVVKHILGPVLVLAPAGSGKTALLAFRAEQALAKGIPPKDMLYLTFTNLAARQLREQVECAAPQHARDIWMGTFHGFCASVLHIEAKHIGLPGDFVVYDEEDCQDLLAQIIRKDRMDGMGGPADLLTIFDNAKARANRNGLLLNGYDGRDILDERQRDLFLRYARELITRHALDFSDLIYFVRAVFANVPNVRHKWSGRFQFIQVDEVQDTHLAEYDVIRTLASAKNIAMFGDLDQSIYGWRGATPIEVRDCFVRDFQPTVYKLPVNYRATRLLVQAADSFASRVFSRRFTKLIPDSSCPEGTPIGVHHAASEGAEATWIGNQINTEHCRAGLAFRDIAVLCRTNKKAHQIGSALEKMNIPCLTVDQYQFFRRQEIKDAIAFLKLLLNPHDISAAHRIALRYVKGAGAATVERIITEGQGVGVRLPDFLSSETFVNDDPYGELVQAYKGGTLIFLDTETTGLSPVSDNIVELAYCILSSGRCQKEASTLVRSDKPVGSSVHVHGITDEALYQNGLEPSKVLFDLLKDSADGLVVGHNVSFDLSIIRSQAARLNLDMPVHSYVDTYEMTRRFVDTQSYRLTDLCKLFELPLEPAHRALGDVKTTIALLKHLMPRIIKGQPERRSFIAKNRKTFESFAKRFSGFRVEAGRQRPAVLLDAMLGDLGVLAAYENEPRRRDNLRHLVSLFQEQDRPELPPGDALHVLVQFASLAKSLDHLSESMDKVIVAPIHQSKGLEFLIVFISGAVDGFIPIFHASDVEEEKRLFYVAMTRPKHSLFITGFKEYVNQYGRAFPKTITPFVWQIDSALVKKC